jgi:predicted acylesterase/phospholipase RssA
MSTVGSEVEMTQRRSVRVLAVDGGGVRGILPSRVLAALEEMTGRPTAELFDLAVGTSIGGIGVLSLARPGTDGRPMCSAEDLMAFFTDRAADIFPGPSLNWPRSLRELEDMVRRPTHSVAVLGINREVGNARYSPEGLRRALEDRLGDATLGDAIVDVVVTSYDVRGQRPIVFRSSDVRAGVEPDRSMLEVAMATAAAPTYFPAVEAEAGGGEPLVLVDGGVFASSPAMLAYVEGVRLARKLDLGAETVEVVSLGTGAAPARPELTHADFVGKSWFKLAQAIFEAAQVGQSSVNDEMLGTLLAGRYWRFDTTLAEGVSMSMDDTTPDNLAALHRLATALVGRRIGDLHRLAAHLADPAEGSRS